MWRRDATGRPILPAVNTTLLHCPDCREDGCDRPSCDRGAALQTRLEHEYERQLGVRPAGR